MTSKIVQVRIKVVVANDRGEYEVNFTNGDVIDVFVRNEADYIERCKQPVVDQWPRDRYAAIHAAKKSISKLVQKW